MGLCLGKTSTASPCWADLPPEIAGEILSRLPTQDDRLSFKAVCREWRLAARQEGQQLRPVVPCINLGHGVYQSIATEDAASKVRRRRRRFGTATDIQVGDTFGSWVMYEDMRSRRSFLRDPFSPWTPAIEVPCDYACRDNCVTCDPRAILLHEHSLFGVKKIIVCSSRLVAAMTNYSVLIDASANLACFRPDTTVVHWTRDSSYVDIAFHRGKIFAIKTNEHLFSHSLELDGGVQSLQSPANLRENFSLHALVKEVPSQGWTEHAIKEGPAVLEATDQNHLHLVNSSDEQKLLMVRWSIAHQTDDVEADNREMNLQVFEADLDKGKWSEVKDLGSQVLFVGRTGSRAFSVEGLSEHYYGQKFSGGNRVFILGKDWALAHGGRLGRQKFKKGIPSYCAYDMATAKTSLVSLNGRHDSIKSAKSGWFFPSK